ncbi:ATP-binding protein [Rhodococcus sp. D-1]|uniref:ATP-binding protein n=1 Tax=Rhodococcus sp. D-1 TaxID=1912238 RepID=UPI0011798B85|nr:ATP-binding protein [Rhodococcus sp. D-1]
MRKVIPMILCKQLYDHKKETDPSGERYLNLIIDEAHNILSTQSTRESEAWRDYRLETFEEIVKEGRKFGVFLTIASQRPTTFPKPSSLSYTITSCTDWSTILTSAPSKKLSPTSMPSRSNPSLSCRPELASSLASPPKFRSS